MIQADENNMYTVHADLATNSNIDLATKFMQDQFGPLHNIKKTATEKFEKIRDLSKSPKTTQAE